MQWVHTIALLFFVTTALCSGPDWGVSLDSTGISWESHWLATPFVSGGTDAAGCRLAVGTGGLDLIRTLGAAPLSWRQTDRDQVSLLKLY
jgi:hypothetical protein